jgi:hypothetical protein
MADNFLLNLLKEDGWRENNYRHEKGDWIVVFDTSSWLEIGTKNTPRIFDIPAPTDIVSARWTLKLITHLCQTNDEIIRLKNQQS